MNIEVVKGRMLRPNRWRCVASLFLVTALLAGAQDYEPSGSPLNPGFSSDFLSRAERYCLDEIELATIAEKKAYSVQTEQFAKQAISDYGKIQAGVKHVAEQEQLSLPSRLNIQDQTLKRTLEHDKPRQLDQDYLNAMVRQEKIELNDFEAQSIQGRDPAVQRLAAKDLPIVKAALKRAETAYSAVNANQITPRPQYR